MISDEAKGKLFAMMLEDDGSDGMLTTHKGRPAIHADSITIYTDENETIVEMSFQGKPVWRDVCEKRLDDSVTVGGVDLYAYLELKGA